ncbi:MAG: hypothetical protein PHX18_01075 [Candidatus Gastranaerophilales bacterium]|nr:hypothetical protein [Candidatus Gastranaerophilales bacterium]
MNSVSFKSNNNTEQKFVNQSRPQQQYYTAQSVRSSDDIGTDLLYGSALGVGAWTVVSQIQKFLSGNFLSKIMIYFGKKIEQSKLRDLINSMYEKSNIGKFGVKTALVKNINGDINNACYSMKDKMVYYTKNTLSALPHELGHAIIDNKTKFMSFLQKNFYGKPFMIFNYLFLAAMGLNIASKQLRKQDGGKYELLEKTNKFVDKHYTLIGMLGFAPLLLSEFGASAIAVSYAIKNKNFGRGNLIKLIASYAAAFGTYLMATFGTLFLTDKGLELTQRGKRQQQQNIAKVRNNAANNMKNQMKITNEVKKPPEAKPQENKSAVVAVINRPLPDVFKQFALKPAQIHHES